MQARPVLFWLLVCVSLQFAATTSVEPASASITFEPLNCVACEAGFYLSQESLNCTACPAGSSTFDYRNASSALHCVCRPGFENQTEIGQDGEMCEPCRQGFFKENLANASCVRCPRKLLDPRRRQRECERLRLRPRLLEARAGGPRAALRAVRAWLLQANAGGRGLLAVPRTPLLPV